MNDVHGVKDIYGKTYHLRQGEENTKKSGNPRPFQTEPKLIVFQAPDYFGDVVTSEAYLYGLKGYALQQPLTESPSYPSGHTTYGYTESLVLALLIPERYPQMIARGAEYGNDRIILGAHYAMDVIAGRTLALYDMAHLLSDHEKRLGIVKDPGKPDDFAGAMAAARSDLRKLFEAECRSSLAACARRDLGRFHHLDRVRAFYESTQTYGLPIVFAKTAKRKEDVAKLAPEACALLQAAFPILSCPTADSILTETEGPGGGFLDDGSPYGVYSRLDLYKAGLEAIAATSAKHAQ